MHEKHYLILLDIDTRKRHYHITDEDIDENWEFYREKQVHLGTS
jgi:hypothetical protein